MKFVECTFERNTRHHQPPGSFDHATTSINKGDIPSCCSAMLRTSIHWYHLHPSIINLNRNRTHGSTNAIQRSYAPTRCPNTISPLYRLTRSPFNQPTPPPRSSDGPHIKLYSHPPTSHLSPPPSDLPQKSSATHYSSPSSSAPCSPEFSPPRYLQEN